uniref:Cytoplasmic tRNA 2-thiolation protein 2 n=1 Tax=Meloidogyne floridensis TaxID=298350 RepID=A0A915P3G3_9BILA
LISNCRSPSVRIELLRLIRTKLLANYAAYFNFPSVLLSENADQLATETINSLCFGRGSSIFDISSVIDDRVSTNSLPFVNHSIQFIRPLRDISYKELEALDRIESCENIEENGINTRINGIIKEENSVQSLAKDFIESLRDNGFPATISTILSVSSKIESERNGQICTLCFGRFQREDEEINNKSCLFLLKICQPCLSILEDIENEGINLLQEIVNL